MQYKPEIDGLRAIAVLSVVLFHFDVTALSGGFVGVDVFFVISGYLITSIIAHELASGTFSFREFYARRARRILPASLLVLAAVAIFGWMEVYPSDLVVLGQSVLSTVFFVSNFFFYGETDYFGAESETLHLLHTWSLAVEEQFYVFFPLLMFALRKRTPARLYAILAVIAGVSLVVSAVGAFHAPELTFYMLPPRAWELLLGSLLALRPLPLRSQLHASLITLAGLGLIAGAVLFIDGETPFPGLAALPPTLGAACIIAAAERAAPFLRFVLNNGVMVGIGKISYSLYLWHWPMAVFYRVTYEGDDDLTPLLLLPCVVLSILSYFIVEQPFRRASFLSPAPKIALALGASALLATFGIVAIRSHGMVFGLDAQAARILDAPNQRHDISYGGDCFHGSNKPWSRFPVQECLTPSPRDRNVLLWGDSAGAHYRIGLERAGSDRGVHILQATQAGCRPGLGMHLKKRPYCEEVNQGVLAYVKKHRPDLIVLAGQWHTHRRTYKKPLQTLVDTLHRLDLRVVVLGPAIHYKRPLPELLVKHIKEKKPFRTKEYLREGALTIDADFKQGRVNLQEARIVSLYDLMCPDLQCPTLTPEGSPLVWDSHHLTHEGSMLVGTKLMPLLEAELAKGNLKASQR